MTKDTLTDNRNHSFFMVDNEVITHFKLTPHQLAVYMVLAMRTWSGKKSAFPGLSTIATDSGMSRRTVVNCIKDLEQLKLIEVVRTKSEHGGNEVNHYALTDVKALVASKGGAADALPPSAADALPLVQQMHPKNTKDKNKDTNVSTGTLSDTFNFNEYNQTIQDVFGVNGGRSTNLLHLMRGTSQTGDYKKYAITPAATIDELRGFKKWWTEKYDNATIPKSAEKIQDHFYAFRKFEERRNAAELARKASAAKIESIPEATPEQRQATAAAMKEARELMRKDKGA